jgi:uncharacterized membrane protein
VITHATSETVGGPGTALRRVADPRIAIAVIAGAQLMVALDVTIVNIALPHIQAALHFSRSSLAWVIDAYTLVFGGLMLLGGRAADVLGRKRMFIVGPGRVLGGQPGRRAGHECRPADRRPRCARRRRGHCQPARSADSASRPRRVRLMPVRYRQLSGMSLERLTALSDGIFAVAMTLLVLGLSVKTLKLAHPDEGDVWDLVLKPLGPHLLTYLMSFLTLGIFWMGQQTELNHVRRSDRNFTWIHLAYLLCVSLMPFSTTLLADYITFRVAVVVYWLNLLLLGVVLFCGLQYAKRAGLLREEVTRDITAASERRIVVYQALYAFGALLTLASTYLAIGFLVAVQLNSAIAPRIWPLDRF